MEQEIENTIRAADTGVGPKVIHHFPEVHALLIEYLDGVTLNAAQVPRHLDAIATACRTLHAGPPLRQRLLDLRQAPRLPPPLPYERAGHPARL
ncbi:hypothetical protein [Nonomuraea dietziae]|uniref:hypothetical protein n=1 Tax=Nonomuraea dietziae TaxID=65515 RepID=UPI0031CDDB2A